jgi:hypothetical protein
MSEFTLEKIPKIYPDIFSFKYLTFVSTRHDTTESSKDQENIR